MKDKIMALFIIFLGIAGGALRIFQLETAFESESGLPVSGNLYTLALLILSGAAVLLCIIFAATKKNPRTGTLTEAFTKPGKFATGLAVLAVAALFLAGVLNMYFSVYAFSLSGMINACLNIFAALSLVFIVIAVSKSAEREEAGVLVLVPVFWAAFWLVLVFREYTINPVITDYIIPLFAMISVLLAFFYFAAFFFGKGSLKRLFFGNLMCLYFCLVSIIGHVVYTLLKSPFSDMIKKGTSASDALYSVLIFTAGILFSLYCLALYTKPENAEVKKLRMQ